MSDEEVQQEIYSVFSVPMGKGLIFSVFLQPAGAGTKTLTVPAVSSLFCWTAQQVARLGGYKQPILAKDELKIPQNSDISISTCVYYNITMQSSSSDVEDGMYNDVSIDSAQK